MNYPSTLMFVALGSIVAATGCVVEMHPADSTPAASAPVASSAPAPATTAPQQVQVVSGPSGIHPPTRQHPATTTATDTATTTATATDTTTSTTTTTTAGAAAP